MEFRRCVGAIFLYDVLGADAYDVSDAVLRRTVTLITILCSEPLFGGCVL